MSDEVAEVLLRATDAGDTYLSWTWLRRPCRPQVAQLPATQVEPVLAELNSGLFVGERNDAKAHSANLMPLTAGAFSNHDDEYRLADALAKAVLPRELADQIREEAAAQPVRIRVCPSPRLSRVPWETLVLSDGRRLIEVAEIVLDAPASIYADRGRQPRRWDEVATQPALHVVDPKLASCDSQVLTTGGKRLFIRRLECLADEGRALPTKILGRQQPQAVVTRRQLSVELGQPLSRMFYIGHVSSDPEEPGTASLHLSDSPDEFGLHRRVEGNLPLSALDLLFGTSMSDDPEVWAKFGPARTRKQPGYEIWPMPCRVALVGCEGSVDFRSVETFGLVVAVLNAGAELVTATRWPLPTDTAFQTALRMKNLAQYAVSGGARAAAGEPRQPLDSVLPTTELALEVDAAHESDDPVAHLRRWQLGRLALWRANRDDFQYSPITWAALTHTFAPRRDRVGGSHPASDDRRRIPPMHNC